MDELRSAVSIALYEQEVDPTSAAAILEAFDEAYAPLLAALAILKVDGQDKEREVMWRYGVRHAVSVIEGAL